MNEYLQPLDPEDPENPGGPGGGGGGPTTPSGLPGTALFEFQFNKHEAASTLKVLAYASVSSGDDLHFWGYLGINGQIYQHTRVNLRLDLTNSDAAMPITLPAFVGGIPAGWHTVTFSIRNFEPDSPLQVLAGSTIEVTELKQGAT